MFIQAISLVILVISTSLEKLSSFPSTDIIMVAQFCCYSGFFLQTIIIIFFPLLNFLNKITKPQCKTSFGKLLRPTLYCKVFAELNLIEWSLTKTRHLRDLNKFQFIHKILLVRFKRFLSKAKQQERLSDNRSFTSFTLSYKTRIVKVILN